MVSNQISLNPFSIARVLGAVAFLLVLANIVGVLMTYMNGHDRFYGLAGLFYVDNEQNIPTFFSVFLLLFAALLLLVITVLERNRNASHVLHWAILSFGFLYIAADEFIALHERLVKPMRKLLGDGNLGIFYFAWVIPGMALVLVLAMFFLRFWLRLPAKTRLTFLMAATCYIGGSIGFELIGGRYAELHGFHNLTYSMIATVEESLEMTGVIIFIWGLLVYIAENHKEVQFRFDGFRGEATLDGP